MEQRRINPFQRGRPIDDPGGFFGRERELERLGGLLGALNWVSLVGPRRIGKTSLLMQLRRPRVAESLGLDPAQYAVAFVDAQGLGGLDAAGWRSLLVDHAAEALGVSPPGEVRNGLQLRRSFQSLLAGGRKLILLLDEFENLAGDPNLNADFFGELRALSSGYPVAFVTASRLALAELTYHDRSVLSSPFFNVFVTMRLGLLEEAAARALASRPEAGFDAETVEFLLELAGPHPFFLQIAGHHAFEQAQAGRLDPAAREGVRRVVEGEVGEHLSYAWRHLGRQARYSLVTLPLARPDDESLGDLREACLVRGGGYLSPPVERFARHQVVPEVLQARGLWVDLRRARAVWRRQPLALSGIPYGLLCYFLRHPNEWVPWQQLEREVWPDRQDDPDRVDARVDALRKQLREAGAGGPVRLQDGRYIFETDLISAVSD